MGAHGKTLKLFAGSSCPKLSHAVAEKLKTELSCCTVEKFSDGECNINIGESVRGCDVFVLQSTSSPVNDNLMELLIMIDALKRASAERITAVIPYFGYARQDRKAQARDPITAKLVADLITSAGANRILTMDLHAPQLQGFFNIPVDHLFGLPVLVRHLLKEEYVRDDMEDLVIVSPDVGSVKRARQLAERLGASLAIVDKRRPRANEMEVMNIVGDVSGKRCLIIDDMIDTAGTITQGAQALIEVGKAKSVFACCTHPVLSGPAIKRLEESVIEKLFVLDTIQRDATHDLDKIVEISVASIFAQAIESIFSDLPLSRLYE